MVCGVRGVDGMRTMALRLSVVLAAFILIAPGGAAWASEAGAHVEHHLNWGDFLLRLLNFTLLAAILFRLLKKPISGFFTTRRSDIQVMLTELEQKKLEAEKATADYKAKMDTLEADTRKIVDELVAEGEIERQKIIEAAHRQAEYIKEQAHVAVQQEIKAAKEALREEMGELSVTTAEELIRKHLGPEDQDRLTRDFMTRVVEAK